EVQSTTGAPSPLPLEESDDPLWHFGMASQPEAPVDPIAVVGTLATPHLDVSHDVRLSVQRQTERATPWTEDPAPLPVLVVLPVGPLVGVAANAPASEPLMESEVRLSEPASAGHRAEVAGPPGHLRAQGLDQSGLRDGLPLVDRVTEILLVPFHGRVAGPDDEPLLLAPPMGVFPGMGASGWKHSDVEPQEVEPGATAVVLLEGVHDARLARMQLKPDPAQPRLDRRSQ